MKTQFENIAQVLSAINNLMITSITDVKWIKLFSAFKLSANTTGNYLLPLAKQLFRDNFMGSEMEMGVILFFIKGYFLLAVIAITNNSLAARFKKLRESVIENVVLHHDDFSQHRQAA
ncbi:MAG: hypothetical protein ACHQIM_17990 [Sphingobacteriales bacterium]